MLLAKTCMNLNLKSDSKSINILRFDFGGDSASDLMICCQSATSSLVDFLKKKHFFTEFAIGFCKNIKGILTLMPFQLHDLHAHQLLKQ